MEIHLIPGVAARPVRFAVLWQHRPDCASCFLPEDDAPDARHLGAYLPDGRLVGVCTLLAQAPTHYPDAVPAGRRPYRLRAMATLPEVRGTGVGAALVRRAIAEAAACGADFLWFDAREAAFGFYERMGLRYLSEPFDIAPIGKHRVMGGEVGG